VGLSKTATTNSAQHLKVVVASRMSGRVVPDSTFLARGVSLSEHGGAAVFSLSINRSSFVRKRRVLKCIRSCLMRNGREGIASSLTTRTCTTRKYTKQQSSTDSSVLVRGQVHHM
ncbi:unnamed protein product, partial [Ectocarpus sp. 12 AP-2014]